MKTLVTGGTGFIGSKVVDLLLEQGQSVTVLSRWPEVPDRWKGRDVTVALGDLRDISPVLDAMKGKDLVFHIGEVRNTSAGKAAVNVRLVEQMTASLKGSGVKRLVFVSSISVAGVPLAVPATEETPSSQVLRDHYTEYKRKAEETVRQSGAGYVIVRPGVVYGTGSRYLGRLVDTIRRFGPLGLPFIGQGKNLLPLIHVDDLSRAIALAGSAPGAADQTLNLTDGERRTWLELFSLIAEANRRRFRIIPVHPALARLPARFFDLLTGIFGQSLDLPSFVDYVSRDVHFSCAKAKSVLDWSPQRLDLRDAVYEMVAWYGKKRAGESA
jgi:nucleoside-diphosphate-sugar epimerase